MLLKIKTEADERKETQKMKETVTLILKKNVFNQTKEEKLKVLEYEDLINDIPSNTSLTKIKLFFFNMKIIASNYEFNQITLYLIVSLSTILMNFLPLYSVLLLDISSRFITLKNVFRSITYNSKQIIMTVIFVIIIIYIYALFAYYYISETFFNPNLGDEGGENMCISVWRCFLTIFSLVSFQFS